MSLLMDALKKADEAKKKQVVATAGLNTRSDSSSENQDPATEAKDSLASNTVEESLVTDAEEELFLIEVTDDETLSTTALTEITPISEESEDKDNFSLITETNEPFLSEFQADSLEAESKHSWDDEFLPEFQQDLQELETASTEESAPLEKIMPFDEFTAYNDLELVPTQSAGETPEEMTIAESTPERQLAKPQKTELEIPEALSESTPPLTSFPHQAKNWFLSLPLSNKSKSDTTTIDLEAEISTQVEPEIEQELFRIEQVTQTEPATPPTQPDDHQIAQHILAAQTSATADSKRTGWLSGLLVVLLIGMGGSYYYYTQSSLIQPSSLKFGQLNQRLKTTSLSTPPVTEATDSTEIPPNSISPNSMESHQPIVAQTQPPISPEPFEVTHPPIEQSNIIPAPEPINQVKAVEDKPSRDQSTVSTENLLANTTIRTAMTKLIADEVAKQFAVKMTQIATEQKSTKATATSSPTPADLPSATKTRLPEKNQPNTTVPIPPEPTATTTESTQMPTLHKNLTEQMNNELSSAYKSFHQGNEKLAYDTYHRILQQDPNNRDALLGFAALAVRHGNISLARQYYQQVLQSYPQDPHAQVGLINTLNYQPANSESQLKLLLEKSPQSAYIYFSLGNLYANQGRWAQAQQAYFDAYRYESSQADYAYNLAISLDQLNQTGAALNYYQQALRLAQNQQVNFNQPAVQKRVQTLTAYTRPSALDNLSTQLNDN